MKIYLLLFLFVAGFLFSCSSSKDISEQAELSAEELEQKLGIPEIDTSEVQYYKLSERDDGNIKHKEFLNTMRYALRIPSELRGKGLKGKVILEVLITKDGNPFVTKLTNIVHPQLTQSVFQAIKKYRYEPYKVDNKPVNALTTFSIEFNIE